MTEEQKTWVTQTDDIYFMPEKKEFICTSDKSGWRHLNLYDFNNNIKSRLTNGKWQVSSLDYVDEKNGWIYFTANEKSSLESHFYRIKMDGSGFERLSKEEGWHSINMCPTGEYYIDTYSTVMVPPRMDLYKADGSKLHTIEENKVEELSQYQMTTPEFFTIPTEDGKELPAIMIKPPNFEKNKQYSVIFTIYGGPESLRVANRWESRGRTLWYQLLADHGFIVLTVENRCSIHFGKEGANLMHRNLGHWEVEDLKSSVRYMRKLPYVKPNSIGIWGGSYGGYNTCLNMLKAPDYFQVGAAIAPVTDWHDYDTIYTERYMDKPQDNPEGYKKSSTLPIANQLKGKLLIIHGTLDDNVHMQNSIQLAHELIKHNKQFSFMVYPRCGHGFQYGNSQRHMYKLITDYFMTHLN
jgi:dipeptidyl-peptidase-4